MTERRPFRDVKLQWLQQLSCDGDLSDSARSVALYIVTTHMNGHTEKAWPSYQTIADAMSKSVKTIQRAVKELEDKDWFQVRRGNGVGHNTEYSPSEASILRACEAREKTDKIVPLRGSKGGQICPGSRSNLSSKGGQNCPPNLEKEKIKKPNARERALAREAAQRPLPLVFVAKAQASQLAAWESWLRENALPGLSEIFPETNSMGLAGYRLPRRWPPDSSSPEIPKILANFRNQIFHSPSFKPSQHPTGAAA